MFRTPARYEIKLEGEEFVLSPRAAFQGQHHKPIVTRASSATTHAIGIMFKPSAVYQLWRLNMRKLTQKVSDAEALLGDEITRLVDDLSQPGSNEQCIEIVTRYLESRIEKHGVAHSRSEKVVELMQQRMGTMPVGELATQFNVSNRALERIFAEEIGVAPKYLNRVLQFNNALQILKYTPEIRWADLAARAGYYDHAHMIKAFIEFSGKTPVGYDGKDHRFTETHLNKESDKNINIYE